MDNKYYPAFPIVMYPGTSDEDSYPGMTKRELAFFITLGGYLASYAGASGDPKTDHVVNKVIEYIDTGFEALEKQPASDKK